MEYTREYWKSRIATKPNRFRKLNESNDYVELINEPEAISQAGTAFTADRLNNIEAGIEGVVAEVNEIQGVLDLTDEVPTFAGNADTATAPLYQWKKEGSSLYRYAPGESPTTTHYWYKVCKITTAMTFDLELFSDYNFVHRASYRLSVSAYSPDSAYTVALFNLGQTIADKADLAVALDADGYLYIQTNAVWWCYLHVTLLYSASSDFSVTMDKLGYAAFGSASGFTPVKIITQTGGFRVANGVVSGTDISPVIHTNIIGNVTGNASTATKLATARKINGVSFDGSADITVADATKAPINSPAFTGSPTVNGGTVWHSGNDGAGSGLDADLVRGLSIVESNANGLIFGMDVDRPTHQYGGNNQTFLTVNCYWTGTWFRKNESQSATVFVLNKTSGDIEMRYAPAGTGPIEWTVSKVWNEANDGPGSGLDADLLDGQHGSYYAPKASPALTGTPTAPTPATGTNNTQIATTAFVKNQNYEPNRGAGARSIALGNGAEAIGLASTALGVESKASGDGSVALGTYAEATRDYQISIGTKFVYFRFPSNTTEATVYTALSPWVNPTVPSLQGAIGSIFTVDVTELRRDSSTTIQLFTNSDNLIKTIRSGNTTPIGQDFAICTVKY